MNIRYNINLGITDFRIRTDLYIDPNQEDGAYLRIWRWFSSTTYNAHCQISDEITKLYEPAG